jgi:lipoprotein-releasing system permease protein
MSIFTQIVSKLPFELFVGLRYTKAKRKNHFISFISFTSMIGIALGVAALIIVMSVMNGFQAELRNRILGVASHLEITGANNQLSDWSKLANQVKSNPSNPSINPSAPSAHTIFPCHLPTVQESSSLA